MSLLIMSLPISIVLPLFKPNECHLMVMLDSIVAQMYPSDELLIHFDDGNASGLPNKYKSAGNIVTLPLTQAFLGVNDSFSRLVRHASHEVVVFADQDDKWFPGRLEEIRAYFASGVEKSVLALRPIICNSLLVPDARATKFFYWRMKLPQVFMLIANGVVGNCLSVRRDFFLSYTSHPFAIVGMYDWHVGVISSFLGCLSIIDYPGTYWRLHDSSATSHLRQSFRLRQKLAWRLQLIRCIFILLYVYLTREYSSHSFLKSSSSKF